MLPIIGTVVCSTAGRDSGKFMIVVGHDNGKVLVCDGKERPMGRPKLKNMKHISLTDTCLTEEQMLTNKSMRHALNDFKAHTCQGEI